MKAKHLAELLMQVPDANVVMQSLEEPSAGLVQVAIIYDKEQVEIVEDMDEGDSEGS